MGIMCSGVQKLRIYNHINLIQRKRLLKPEACDHALAGNCEMRCSLLVVSRGSSRVWLSAPDFFRYYCRSKPCTFHEHPEHIK